jgi:hypothetical protein
MKLQEYTRVRLLSDAYQGERLKPGAMGYIIEVYSDAYEVEFSDSQGNTIAQLVLREEEVESAPETAMKAGDNR